MSRAPVMRLTGQVSANEFEARWLMSAPALSRCEWAGTGPGCCRRHWEGGARDARRVSAVERSRSPGRGHYDEWQESGRTLWIRETTSFDGLGLDTSVNRVSVANPETALATLTARPAGA